MGGLDLYLDTDELLQIYPGLPDCSKMLSKLWLAEPSEHIKAAAGKVCDPISRRGFSFTDRFMEYLRVEGVSEFLSILGLPALETKTVYELKRDLKTFGLPERQFGSLIERSGWLTADRIIEKLSRSLLFNEIFNGIPSTTRYGVISWKERVARLWDQILIESHYPWCVQEPLTREEWQLIERSLNFNKVLCYNVECRTPVTVVDANLDVSREAVSVVTLLEAGLPDLRLPSLLKGENKRKHAFTEVSPLYEKGVVLEADSITPSKRPFTAQLKQSYKSPRRSADCGEEGATTAKRVCLDERIADAGETSPDRRGTLE
jgi:hypothetical protein